MKILVINAGSSSLKFTLFQMEQEKVLAKGVVERIGLESPNLIYECSNGHEHQTDADVDDHTAAVELVCRTLTDGDCPVLNSLEEVDAVGHRVVHGGEKFTEATRVTEDVKRIIDECASLAPLHNPPNLDGIRASEKALSGTLNVAVFDTAFHQSMPAESYLYAIPHAMYEQHGIRKYGFHGTSHMFVANAAADFLGKPLNELKLITAHIGNGASITAISRGNVIDTSMGMTPLAGLIMGTRCGDIDPGVVLHMIKTGMDADAIDTLLNKKSGLLGVAEIGSSDMRDILSASAEGRANARQALEMFVHRLVFYIGGYYTLLQGADALVFTGGIGENSTPVRKEIVSRLGTLHCELDAAANEQRGEAAEISTPDSSLRALVIPTDEELMIARETQRLAGNAGQN